MNSAAATTRCVDVHLERKKSLTVINEPSSYVPPVSKAYKSKKVHTQTELAMNSLSQISLFASM